MIIMLQHTFEVKITDNEVRALNEILKHVDDNKVESNSLPYLTEWRKFAKEASETSFYGTGEEE